MACDPTRRFGPWELYLSQIFYESPLCYGIVNLKPIVPGHVLIIPKRVSVRIADLSSEEMTDLFSTVQKVGPVLENYYGGDALNIAIQDGKAAGQSVPHVHVHIIPRKVNFTRLCSLTHIIIQTGDFERNDDVYEELDHHDAKIDFNRERITRTREDMAEEATRLRQLFT
jgi:bis(5'-adenosyl)-triphosphatase